MSQAIIKTLVDENEVTIYPRTTVEAVYGLEGIGDHVDDTANPHKVTAKQIGAMTANQMVVVLSASSWNTSTLTTSVSCANVTSSNVIMVSPAPASYTDYGTCKIRAIEQSSKSLKFKCDTIPTVDIPVNVVAIN